MSIIIFKIKLISSNYIIFMLYVLIGERLDAMYE